jgi:hypothetical protein
MIKAKPRPLSLWRYRTLSRPRLTSYPLVTAINRLPFYQRVLCGPPPYPEMVNWGIISSQPVFNIS